MYINVNEFTPFAWLSGNSYLHLFRSYINFYIHLITLNLISYKTDIYT